MAIFGERNIDVNIHNRLTKSIRPPLPRSKEAIDDETKMQKRERDYRNQEKTIRYENEGLKIDAMGVLVCTVPWDDADTKASIIRNCDSGKKHIEILSKI